MKLFGPLEGQHHLKVFEYLSTHMWIILMLISHHSWTWGVCVCVCVCVCAFVYMHHLWIDVHQSHSCYCSSVLPSSMSALQAFSTDSSFDVGKEGDQMLWCDHRPRPNHTLPSCLEFFLGRTLYSSEVSQSSFMKTLEDKQQNVSIHSPFTLILDYLQWLNQIRTICKYYPWSALLLLVCMCSFNDNYYFCVSQCVCTYHLWMEFDGIWDVTNKKRVTLKTGRSWGEATCDQACVDCPGRGRGRGTHRLLYWLMRLMMATSISLIGIRLTTLTMHLHSQNILVTPVWVGPLRCLLLPSS